jgi:hypothetical protein
MHSSGVTRRARLLGICFAGNLAPAITEAVHQINAKVPLPDVRALYETTQISTSFARIQALFATVFGLSALALASTGIYGLVATARNCAPT